MDSDKIVPWVRVATSNMIIMMLDQHLAEIGEQAYFMLDGTFSAHPDGYC